MSEDCLKLLARRRCSKYRKNHKEILNRKLKEYLKKREEDGTLKKRKYTPEIGRKRNQAIKKNKYLFLKERIRGSFRNVLKRYSKTGKIMSSKKYGVDYKKIIEHLKPFPKDLSKYHIDHIIPLSWFDFSNPKEIKWAFAPENHQWLTIQENLKKSNKEIIINYSNLK